MVKYKTDQNETSDLPQLSFEYNTASTELEEKIFKRFVELATADPDTHSIGVTETVNANGTTTVTINLTAL